MPVITTKKPQPSKHQVVTIDINVTTPVVRKPRPSAPAAGNSGIQVNPNIHDNFKGKPQAKPSKPQPSATAAGNSGIQVNPNIQGNNPGSGGIQVNPNIKGNFK